MRILFSGQSGGGAGHVFPMLPLERAARAAGHETAVMTGAALAPLLPAGLRLLAVGRPFAQVVAETMRRPEGGDPAQPGPGAVEFFAGVSVDLTYDDAFREASAFEPDVIICEAVDYTGRLVAAALGVPWVLHGIAGPLPPELVDGWDARAARQFAQRSLTRRDPIAFVDPYPALLSGGQVDPLATSSAVRLPMRPVAHAGAPARSSEVEVAALDPTSPTVLLTVGTSIHAEHDGDPLPAMLAATLAADAQVVVTADADKIDAGSTDGRVHAVGFVPLAELLPRVDAVVTVGGSGTVLASLAAGLPMVVLPIQADQPFNAARVSALGAGVAVDTVEDITSALRRVLSDATIRDAARRVSARLSALPSPDRVLEQLLAVLARQPVVRRAPSSTRGRLGAEG